MTFERARTGDRLAQAQALREVQDPIHRFCLSLLSDADRAADASQETALRVLKLLPGFAFRSSFKTWCLGIALNVVREHRRARPVPEARDRPAIDPGTQAALREQCDRVQHALAGLADRQREAVVLRYFEDLSIDEIAHAMNAAPGTIKATLFQALRVMRKKMDAGANE